jgi:hypothetical protein
LERESKTKKREFLDPRVTNITSGGHKPLIIKNMKTMRKCNDEIYQLTKDKALVKKLKNNKRFMPFCLCPPDVMFVTRGSKNSLFFVFVLLGPP